MLRSAGSVALLFLVAISWAHAGYSSSASSSPSANNGVKSIRRITPSASVPVQTTITHEHEYYPASSAASAQYYYPQEPVVRSHPHHPKKHYGHRMQMQGSEAVAHIQERGHLARGGGGGWGWGGDEIQSVLLVGIPLLLILILWPLCLFSLVGSGAGHGWGGGGGHHGGGWGGWGWKRSIDSNLKEDLKNKVEEVAEKILPKLNKSN